MSVLVKGMEMPKGCGICPCSIYGDCDAVEPRKRLTAKYRWSADERPNWCPLVEVPTPHGRLIDADKLERDEVFTSEYGFQEVVWTEQIDEAPTIIEAEGERSQ